MYLAIWDAEKKNLIVEPSIYLGSPLMSFQITVYLNGKHLFTTDCLSVNETTIREVCGMLKNVLTESKGYKISVTFNYGKKYKSSVSDQSIKK